MNYETLQKAIAEAQRFIDAANKVTYTHYLLSDKTLIDTPSKQAASCRRASLDLTRTLADLRQGG